MKLLIRVSRELQRDSREVELFTVNPVNTAPCAGQPAEEEEEHCPLLVQEVDVLVDVCGGGIGLSFISIPLTGSECTDQSRVGCLKVCDARDKGIQRELE